MTTTVKHYIEAAKQRGWQVKWIDEFRNIVALHPPDQDPIIIRNNVTELGSAIGSVISAYKFASAKLAEQVGFTIPETIVLEGHVHISLATSLLKQHRRIVVKPMDGAFGKGVSLSVTNEHQLEEAVKIARTNNIKSQAVVVQQYCPGNDYRLLYLDGKVIAAIQRVPADDNQVPNLSQGGKAIDVTDKVHPDYQKLIEKLARLIKLDMCGVDLLSDDISMPPAQGKTYFIEINVAPGFKGHYYPDQGQTHDVAAQILDTILAKRELNRQ